MAANVDWFLQKVERIAVSDARSDLLSELKIGLSALNAKDLTDIASVLPLSPIFDCVNTSEKQQLELACDVLGKLLGALEPAAVLAQYGPQIQRTLVHPAAPAKGLVLKELDRAVNGRIDMVERLSAERDLLISVVNCVCVPEMSVARHAISLLKHLGACPAGLAALYSPPMLNAFNTAMRSGDTNRFRVYEVVIAVSAISNEALVASQGSGLLGELIQELQGDDVLAELNALEIMGALALTAHGLSYLDQQGILNSLANKLMNCNENPVGSFVLPGLIKFFGHVSQSKPDEIKQKYPRLLTMLFETLDSSDLTVVGTGIETVGYIGTTLRGKYMLQSLGDNVPQLLRKIIEKLPSVPMDVRVRLLNSVANLLQLNVQDQNNQSLSTTKRWFEALSPQPMDTMMSLCRQPFPEMRLAAFHLMLALANNPWGQEYIVRAPGVMEYLLDRSTESIKTCKDAKFDIVKTLATNPTSSTVMSPEVYERVLEFMRQGEFYVLGETEVAIEGAS